MSELKTENAGGQPFSNNSTCRNDKAVSPEADGFYSLIYQSIIPAMEDLQFLYLLPFLLSLQMSLSRELQTIFQYLKV